MESLTDMSPLSGAPLPGQATLTDSVLNNAALANGTGLTGTLSTIRSTGSGGGYASRETFSHSGSGTAMDTPDLLNRSTKLKMTAVSNSGSKSRAGNQQASLDADPLTGMAEGAPLVSTTAAVQFSSPPPLGVSIKDTDYPISGEAYFVSPTGNDSNAGRQDSPWHTIQKALKSAPVGSTIVLRGGTYREGNLNLNKNLTLQPYPHEEVWLKGSQVITDWVQEGNLWRKDNWNYQFPPNTKPQNINPAYPMAPYRDMVFINSNSLEQVASKDRVGPGKFYVNYADDKLYIGDNPGDKTVESTAFEDAFNMVSASSVVRGLGFAHYAENGVSVNAPSVEIENNTFAWNAVRGLMIWDPEAVIRGNIFSYNGRVGCKATGADRLLFEKNTVRYNNIENFANYDSAGAKFGQTNSLVLRDNVVERNYNHGLWIDVSSTNATVVRNIVSQNRSNGIYFELSHKAIIASNLLVDNANKGISVLDSSNARIYNNTVTNSPENINVQEGPRTNTNSQQVNAGITWKTTDNVIKNNILLNNKGTLGKTGLTFLLNVFNNTNTSNNQMVIDLDHNAYYRAVSNTPPEVIRYKPGTSGQNVRYKTIAAFRAVYPGFEVNALAIDDVATNPFFSDEANGDYRLKADSPANGAGEPLPADIASAIGVQAGIEVDLGVLHLTGV